MSPFDTICVLDFISKLAALVSSPQVNLTRFHGVFAPNSRYRADIIIQKKDNNSAEKDIQPEGEKHRANDMGGTLKASI